MSKNWLQNIDAKEQGRRAKAMTKVLDGVLAVKTELATVRRKNKTYPVVGEGSLASKILLIGEAPGKNESLTGKPFCGASGKLLDKMLASIKIPREDVYVANIVKDRPPENRDPKPSEIEAYAPFLDKQIEILKPEVIAPLGRFSMAYILNRYGKIDPIPAISDAHGQCFEIKTDWGTMKVLPLYHPAVGLYTHSMQDVMFKDFKKIKKLL